MIVGPHRVFPGRLSVSRTFGDIEAKLSSLGGISNVIISEPDIYSFNIDDSCDFIVLGCDGIYDHLTNDQIIDSIWTILEDDEFIMCDFNLQCAISVDMVLKSSMEQKSIDNLSVIFIAFESFKSSYLEAKLLREKSKTLNN